jgi:hypothetical protein
LAIDYLPVSHPSIYLVMPQRCCSRTFARVQLYNKEYNGVGRDKINGTNPRFRGIHYINYAELFTPKKEQSSEIVFLFVS